MSDDRSVTPPEPEIGAVLRARMHDAVGRLEPRDGTLEFLQGAVTARRKQRRTAYATSAMMLVAVGAGLALAGHDLVRGGGGASASLGVQGLNSQAPRSSGAGPGRGAARGQGSAKDTPQLAYPATTAAAPGANASSQGIVSTPFAVAASGRLAAAGCQRSSLLDVTTTPEPTVGGIMYDTVTATVKSACVVSGPPRLYVYDADGTLSSDIPVYRADPALAPELPPVNTWGRTLSLGPGDKYSFELAWAPAVKPCTAEPSGSPPKGSRSAPSEPDTTTPSLSALAVLGSSATGGSNGRGKKPPQDDYTIAYSVNGAATVAMIPLMDGCGSAVYVTDIYPSGEYPEEPEPSGSGDPS